MFLKNLLKSLLFGTFDKLKKSNTLFVFSINSIVHLELICNVINDKYS